MRWKFNQQRWSLILTVLFLTVLLLTVLLLTVWNVVSKTNGHSVIKRMNTAFASFFIRRFYKRVRVVFVNKFIKKINSYHYLNSAPLCKSSAYNSCIEFSWILLLFLQILNIICFFKNANLIEFWDLSFSLELSNMLQKALLILKLKLI